MTIPQASNDDSQAATGRKGRKKAQNGIGPNSLNFGRTAFKSSSFDCKFALDSFQKCNKKGGNSQPFRSCSRLTGV